MLGQVIHIVRDLGTERYRVVDRSAWVSQNHFGEQWLLILWSVGQD